MPSTKIEIELPDNLYGRLEMKAAAAGVPPQEYLLDELRKIVAVFTREEVIERLRQLPAVRTTRDPMDVIREVRDSGRSSSS
jgi:hypothetical protein